MYKSPFQFSRKLFVPLWYIFKSPSVPAAIAMLSSDLKDFLTEILSELPLIFK